MRPATDRTVLGEASQIEMDELRLSTMRRTKTGR